VTIPTGYNGFQGESSRIFSFVWGGLGVLPDKLGQKLLPCHLRTAIYSMPGWMKCGRTPTPLQAASTLMSLG